MTSDEFWNGWPWLAHGYREAYTAKMRTENMLAWRAGLYTKLALQATVGNMFLRKGSIPNEYPSEPLPLTQDDLAEAQRQKELAAEARITKAMMARVKNTK